MSFIHLYFIIDKMRYLPNVRHHHCTCTNRQHACYSAKRLKTYLLGKSIHYTRHPQWLHVRCPPVAQAAISRSPSTTPLRKVETPCHQNWVVVLLQRLGQFPPARASVRLGEARCKRMQSTKQTESGKQTQIIEVNHAWPFDPAHRFHTG